MTANIIRKKFLEFFKNKEHKVFPSDSLVPDDKSVLFTSAGMNQFKPYFLGLKKDIKRAASCQKCLRADDLEEVGKTSYHHTFFEMLGNFSFGDYFKKEAIEFAWEFTTKELNLKKKDLWVSVYIDDTEAYNLWKDHIGIEESRIVKLGEDKNFWPANAKISGPDGPCGPCSEIFFDRGKDFGCKKETCSPACDCGRFVEFWNLVFTQFNRTGPNKLEPLSQKNIDTGMGLERICAIMQNKNSNFEIDIFYPVIEYLKDLFKIKGTKEELPLINAIADHLRASIFAISDGIYPSNEERGYVIRKLIRRSVSFANSLNYRKPFLYSLVEIFSSLMQEPYPELLNKKDIISKILKIEEEKFIPILEEVDNYIYNKKQINAEELFYMYDTLGFPIDAVQLSAKRYNIVLDLEGFNRLLEKQKELSRKKTKFDELIFRKSSINVDEETVFIGYENLEADVNIIKIFVGTEERDILKENDFGMVILDRTPFYPEGGGQSFDKGIIETENGEFLVEEVYKINETIVHKGRVLKGKILEGKAFAKVDKERRFALMRAHTATHILQAVLRRFFGEHIMQQGSLVEPDRFHFDFSHFNKLSDSELEDIERSVNELILKGDKVDKKIVSFDEVKNTDVLAFFKDKYKEKVRIVNIGDYSKELCGGTHLDNTNQIGLFIILDESSVSSGIRRIEAITGKLAYEYINNLKKNIKGVSNLFRCKETDIIDCSKKILEVLKEKDEEIESYERENIALKLDEILNRKIKIKDINFLTCLFKNKDYPILLYLLDLLKRQNNLFVFLVSEIDEKYIFVCSATEDIINRVSPQDFISHFKDSLGIKGGGKKNLIQGIINKDPNIVDKLKKCFSDFYDSIK